jgi:1,2-diacylglycerol 3-alpha-glucosyltransferase
MRVLMISDVYFPRVNGVSTSIRSFRHELQAQGHQVTLIAPHYPHSEAYDQAHPDVDLIRIPSRSIPRDPEDRFMIKSKIMQLIPKLQELNFDVLHIQTPFVAHYAGLTLAKPLKLPVVESYHTFFEEYLYHYIPFLPRNLMRWVARRFTVSQCNVVQQVVAPSRAMRDALLNYGVATPISILPTGLQASQFRQGDGARFRNAHGIELNRPVALYIGRVAHEKNIDFLLRTFQYTLKQLPEALLLIVGEGPAVPHLQKLAQQLGTNEATRFIGYLDRDTQLLDCYSAGDVFIFASRTETQGLVLLEAMAQGTPVLSTIYMGTRDILEGAEGAVIAHENEKLFSQELNILLTNQQKRDQLSIGARRTAAGWSTQAMTYRLVQLYASLKQGNAV